MLMKREANFEDEIWSFFKKNQHTHHNSFAFVKEISGECLRKYMIVLEASSPFPNIYETK